MIHRFIRNHDNRDDIIIIFARCVCVCVFCLTLIFGDASALGHQRKDLFVFCIGTINFWTMNMELYSCRVQLSRYIQIQIQMHIHAHLQINIHTYIHLHIHIHICTLDLCVQFERNRLFSIVNLDVT